MVLVKTDGNMEEQSVSPKLVSPTWIIRPLRSTIRGLPESPEQMVSVPLGPDRVQIMSSCIEQRHYIIIF